MSSMYTYPGSGGFQSQTTGGGMGGGGMDDLTSFYREMAERRMGQMDADRRRRIEAENRARFSKPAPTLGGPQMNPADQHLADLQRRLEIQKIQAATRPAPQKMLTGPQINPGWVDDPSAMSGIERQMYLPQGSSMTGGPTGTEQAAAQQYGGETELDLATEAERRRRAMMGGTGPDRRADYPGSGRGL